MIKKNICIIRFCLFSQSPKLCASNSFTSDCWFDLHRQFDRRSRDKMCVTPGFGTFTLLFHPIRSFPFASPFSFIFLVSCRQFIFISIIIPAKSYRERSRSGQVGRLHTSFACEHATRRTWRPGATHVRVTNAPTRVSYLSSQRTSERASERADELRREREMTA